MDELVVRTEVYAPAEEVYALLEDLERYDQYSKYLRRVRRFGGDGGAGTRYALEFAWWKLTYTAESEVTDVDPPNRIDWRITKDIDAHGRWRVEPLGTDTANEDDEGADAKKHDGTAEDVGTAEDDGTAGSARGDGGAADDESAMEGDESDGTDDESAMEGDESDGTDDESAMEGDESDGTDDEPACEVAFEVNFDPGSASASAVDLPLMVSFDWVLSKAIPLFRTEAERIVERAVADLEGRERDVDLEVTVDSDHL